MPTQKVLWGKVIAWGAVTAIFYAILFSYSEPILHMAKTTPDACVVGSGADAKYFHKIDATACADRGGQFEPGQAWHVLVPILIAFIISFTHGAFTGLFWDVMGLKPASKPGKK